MVSTRTTISEALKQSMNRISASTYNSISLTCNITFPLGIKLLQQLRTIHPLHSKLGICLASWLLCTNASFLFRWRHPSFSCQLHQ